MMFGASRGESSPILMLVVIYFYFTHYCLRLTTFTFNQSTKYSEEYMLYMNNGQEWVERLNVRGWDWIQRCDIVLMQIIKCEKLTISTWDQSEARYQVNYIISSNNSLPPWWGVWAPGLWETTACMCRSTSCCPSLVEHKETVGITLQDHKATHESTVIP